MSTPNPRPDQRPQSRPDDPRARAAERAAAIRDHLGGTMDTGTDEFSLDGIEIPDGWSYEWKQHTVLGKTDPAYQVGLARRGWEPVPISRHPEMMPKGHNGAVIERKGMVLMERPAELTEEVAALDKKRARDQVRQKEAQLNGAPEGQFERNNKGNSLVKVGHSYEKPTIAIPEK